MPIAFEELSEEEAARFLEEWAGGSGERVDWLEHWVPGAAARDRAALRAVWEWYLAARPFPDTGERPMWTAESDLHYVPAGDLAVVDAVASYLVVVLREAFPNLELVVGKQPGMIRYVHRRKPVLRFPDHHEIDPIGIVMAAAANAGDDPDPDELATWWDRAAQRVDTA